MSQTIDITPTWEAIVPALLEAYKYADSAKQENIRAEFIRMAECVDEWNQREKQIGFTGTLPMETTT